MEKSGLKTLNGDTNQEAYKENANLRTEAHTGVSMILLSPEQLSTPGFSRLLEEPAFQARLCVMGVDEAHLIYWWGKDLCPDYKRLGYVRARLPIKNGKRTPAIACTATLRDGEPKDSVCDVLSFEPGSYHFIQRPNMRPESEKK
jgi:superfamily II DNA helicase RecQ